MEKKMQNIEWELLDYVYMSRSNLSMMTAFKGEFHLILQKCPKKQSEGSYPKNPWWMQNLL